MLSGLLTECLSPGMLPEDAIKLIQQQRSEDSSNVGGCHVAPNTACIKKETTFESLQKDV